jgi:Spy/CpxP family protein refolding chaperone
MGGGYGYGHGFGYGPGMMGGVGPGGWGMGPGMMGFGFGAWGAGLDLSQAQVKKIDQIQKAMFDKQWPLMEAMHETMMQGAWAAPRAKLDVDAVMKRAKALSELRLQMLRNRLETQQQMQAVLTPKQREQLQEYGPWGR